MSYMVSEMKDTGAKRQSKIEDKVVFALPRLRTKGLIK